MTQDLTNREMHELAAKAAGNGAEWYRGLGMCTTSPGSEFPKPWRPREDDGDALRLAVALRMDVCFGANYVIVRGLVQMPTVNNANDPDAATREAIFQAAVAIGKAMP